MELEFDWQERDWHGVFGSIPRGSVIPAQRFFAILGTVDESEAMDAALTLEDRGVGLDVSALPRWGKGAAAQRLNREYELVRAGALPGGLEPDDPLRLYLLELERQPKLDEVTARQLVEEDSDPNRLTEGLLWLAVQEAAAFAGQGVLLLDLLQEGALGLMSAVETVHEDILETVRWHIRQAMARTVAIAYMVSGEAERLLASMRAYQQADRRLLERLGRNPGPEELAQELGKTVTETLTIAQMVRDAARATKVQPQPEKTGEEPQESVEDSAYFQLRSRVEELLSTLDETDRRLLTLRFGLEGGRPQTQEEAALSLGLPLEELQRRELAAMAHLRKQ